MREEPISSIYDLHENPALLKHHDRMDTHYPETVLEKYYRKPEILKKYEKVLAKDAGVAYQYAHFILHDRFKLGEPEIAKKAYFAFYYAREVLKAPFPEAEPAIFRSYLKDRYLKMFPDRGKHASTSNFSLQEKVFAPNLLVKENHVSTY
jgi:hypothetical protein